jgi:hypothetical protein
MTASTLRDRMIAGLSAFVPSMPREVSIALIVAVSVCLSVVALVVAAGLSVHPMREMLEQGLVTALPIPSPRAAAAHRHRRGGRGDGGPADGDRGEPSAGRRRRRHVGCAAGIGVATLGHASDGPAANNPETSPEVVLESLVATADRRVYAAGSTGKHRDAAEDPVEPALAPIADTAPA